MKRMFATLALAATVALTAVGCTAHATAPEHTIATLVTPTAVADDPTPTATPVDDGRPRERIDMTKEEKEAMLAPYTKCLTDLGMNVTHRDGSAANIDTSSCDQLFPLPPWEKDAKNPQAVDFAVKVVDCLRAKGVKYVEVSQNTDSGIVGPTFGGPNSDQQSITLGLKYAPVCEQEVYSGTHK